MKRIENYDLSAHNTFRMKVKAALYIEYDSVEELQSLDYKNLPQPIMHIGAGSNLLFTKDFPGTVLHSKVQFLKFVDMGLDEVLVTVGSGVVFDDFVARMCKEGLWGAENLSLIPGEVGASAVQNIGAYGVEVKDIIAGVICLDTTDWSKTLFKVHECAYGYRDSMFKHQKGRYIITSVLFRVSRKYSPKLDYGGVRKALEGRDFQTLTPMDVRNAIIDIRNAKLPDPAVLGSAGSFFKNPVIPREHFERIVALTADAAASQQTDSAASQQTDSAATQQTDSAASQQTDSAATQQTDSAASQQTDSAATVPHYDLPNDMVKVPAAWLIDQCGFRGKMIGGAKVYEKQPLVIVNESGSAAPEEVIALEQSIIAKVYDTYGIELHPEVEHV